MFIDYFSMETVEKQNRTRPGIAGKNAYCTFNTSNHQRTQNYDGGPNHASMQEHKDLSVS